ncbi:hypothetical protein ACJX0J_015496, partial [Zea mays]
KVLLKNEIITWSEITLFVGGGGGGGGGGDKGGLGKHLIKLSLFRFILVASILLFKIKYQKDFSPFNHLHKKIRECLE